MPTLGISWKEGEAAPDDVDEVGVGDGVGDKDGGCCCCCCSCCSRCVVVGL